MLSHESLLLFPALTPCAQMRPTEHLAKRNTSDWSRSERECVRITPFHTRAFAVHISDHSLLLAASAQMFGCRSFSGSSSGICRGKQTEHFESEAQQQRSDTGATLSRCESPTFVCTGNSLLCQERAVVPLTITC